MDSKQIEHPKGDNNNKKKITALFLMWLIVGWTGAHCAYAGGKAGWGSCVAIWVGNVLWGMALLAGAAGWSAAGGLGTGIFIVAIVFGALTGLLVVASIIPAYIAMEEYNRNLAAQAGSDAPIVPVDVAPVPDSQPSLWSDAVVAEGDVSYAGLSYCSCQYAWRCPVCWHY